jgi:hypothetical protein
MIDVQVKTENAQKEMEQAEKKADKAHIKTTELRRNMALLRRDAGLFMDFLESQGVKIDDTTKRAVKLFDECTMIVSDGARIIKMIDAIGISANSALGVIGLVIEAVMLLNQIYAGNNYGMQMRTAVQQATGIPGVGPGFMWGMQTGPYGLTPGLLSGARWRETG